MPDVRTIPMTEYQAIDGLSFTGAVKLLPPSCPAKYRYWRDNPETPSDVFDIGTAAHQLVFGGENRIVVVHHDDWRTKDAKSLRDAARAAGRIALLAEQWQLVQDMAEALWNHPIASALLRGGQFEQSIFWRADGVDRKARLDFLPDRAPTDMYGVDYKSCACAHPDAISKALWSWRYVQQAPFYLDAINALELSSAQHTPFMFIFQEKTPPYVVTVAQPDVDAIRWGRKLNAQAAEIYRQCVAANRWPAYSDDTVSVGLPVYAEYQLSDMEAAGDLETVPA